MHQSYLQTIAHKIEDEEMSTNPGKKPNREPEQTTAAATETLSNPNINPTTFDNVRGQRIRVIGFAFTQNLMECHFSRFEWQTSSEFINTPLAQIINGRKFQYHLLKFCNCAYCHY